jgi:hypothetical protein
MHSLVSEELLYLGTCLLLIGFGLRHGHLCIEDGEVYSLKVDGRLKYWMSSLMASSHFG